MTIVFKRVAARDIALFSRIGPDVFDRPIDPARLRRYLGSPLHRMVVALDQGVIVGQCAAVIHHHPDKPSELYVDEVGTATSHLRRGIATGMLNTMFAWGKELGCTEAWLGTELDNHAANALYRRFRPSEDEAIQYYLFAL